MVAAICLALPAVASATDYWAAHGGSGGCTSASDPCNLPTAVTNAIQTGDRVIVESTGGDFSLGSTLTISHAIDFGGAPGQAAPTINSTASTALLNNNDGATFHDFRLLNPVGNPTLQSSAGGTFDRIFVSGGFDACDLSGPGTIAMRNSVCWGNSFNGGALEQLPPTSGTSTVILRNVTAEATGDHSVGIYVIGSSNAVATIDAANTIGRGTNFDVEAQQYTGGSAHLTFSNSSYALRLDAGGASITPEGTNGNQTAAPQFANFAAGDFHEVAGSPTIDAGVPLGDIGSLDLDRTERIQPSCVGGAGTPDIGAYEIAPPVPSAACSKFTIGELKRNKKKGTAKLTVTVPGAGRLVASGKGLKKTSESASVAGNVVLKLKASGKAKRKLNDAGKAKLKIKLSWAPTGNTAASQTDKVKLKKR
ncbi:MAG: hypothetical protein QOD60_1747 [Solirubrobacterales bacterium]|nr:hypothetical protein [Solirubrobacterales bacterium]